MKRQVSQTDMSIQEEGSESESLLGSDSEPRTSSSKVRRLVVLGCMAAVNLLANMAYSTLAPFFPQEAAKKKGHGSADVEVGLIISTFALVVVVIAPILGSNVATVKPKFMLCSGIFLLGGSTLLFGFVGYIDTWPAFVAVSILVRAIQGLGAAASDTASWTIVCTEFPDKVSTVFGTLEVFSGLGFMIGPSLGGALYTAKGFSLPFYFTGGLLLLFVPALLLILPNSVYQSDDDSNKPSVWKLLRNFWIWMTAIALFFSAASMGLLDTTLANFLKNTYGYQPGKIGLMFLLCSGTYMLSSPLVGHLADKWGTKWIMVSGLLFSGVSYLLMAPSFLLTFFLPEKKIWLFMLSTALLAVGIAMAGVPAVSDLMQSANRMGYKEGLALNGVISGLATSFFSLGESVGPSIGGLLTGMMDFSHSSSAFGLVLAAHGYIYLVLALCFRNRFKTKPSKK
eukprot:m.46083 g.46083  ORF g.46083 m.46083 type:complete len:454 (+) comp33665_c0_seq1:81-1442(+)